MTAVESIIQSNIVTLAPDTSVTAAIELMVSSNHTYVLVVSKKQLLGIFTERDVTRDIASQRQLNGLTLRDVMTESPHTVTLEESQNIFDISQQFLQHHIRHLPVVDRQQRLIGVITPQSLRRNFRPEYLLRYIRVSEVMTTNVLRGRPEDMLLASIQSMAQRKVSCIVITDPITEFPIGIITERDISRLHAQSIDLAAVPVGDVMTRPLRTMQPENSLWAVHEQMQAIQVRRLVISHPTGELAGIVTQTQMLKMMDPVEIYQVMGQMQATIDRQVGDLQRLNRELAISNRELESLATMDELTQVANRRYFNLSLRNIWRRLSYGDSSVAMLLVDVDHFKRYNDTYGHIAGDRCLLEIAQVLQGMVRQSYDLLARYGGEEFVVILPDTDLTGAERLAKSIVERITRHRIPHDDSPTSKWVTLSIGACAIRPRLGYPPEFLIYRTDEALYQAKANGRNGYALAPDLIE
jgi:diguanylate cyclase (GGDEF)-like protein